MNRDVSTDSVDMADELERLVTGELDEAARGRVIAWLEKEPARWRLCGLSFLEAQTWTEALAAWPRRPAEQRKLSRGSIAVSRSPRNHWRLRDAAVLAASVLIAFVLGFAVREPIVEPASDANVAKESASDGVEQSPTDVAQKTRLTPVMATMSMASGLGGLSHSAVQIPVVPRTASPAEPMDAHDSIPDYVRQQWERRGYRLDVERRYLFAKLPDGEQVAVPVEQYFIKRIPPKVN
jgi:hypothetical protein